MKKSVYVAILLFIFIIVAQNQAFAAKDSMPAFMLTFFIGFGTGHFYLNDDAGGQFLTAELVGLGIAIPGAFIGTLVYYFFRYTIFQAPVSGSLYGITEAIVPAFIIFTAGAIVYGVARILEFVDIFGAMSRAKNADEVAIAPRIEAGTKGILLGISVMY